VRASLNAVAPSTLVDLLGGPRAQVVDLLRVQRRGVAELAGELGMSEVAVRRHLQVLERSGLVTGEPVRRDGPGRPGLHYGLTDKARRLFPDRSAEFASELLDYLEMAHGRSALRGFLRWRMERQGERYAAALENTPDPAARTAGLARLLSDDGFLAEVQPVTAPDGATVLQLKQGHCAVKDVAKAHPELCAYEAALFQKILGTKISRRQTIAGGAGECICHISEPTTSARTGAGNGHQG